MTPRPSRRRFIALGVAAAAIASLPGCRSTDKGRGSKKRQARLFFTTRGRTALIDADGTGLRYFDFKVPDQVLFPRRLPGAKVAWEFQPQRPDADHFNRDFKPEQARGGVEICRLNPRDGSVARLTQNAPPVWDFRASESPDGRSVVFCRAETGGVRAIWVMDADGCNQHLLTRGFEDKGADHPRWLPIQCNHESASQPVAKH